MTTVGLARSRVGRVMMVVWSVHVAVVQEQRCVCVRRVHALHGRVHVIHKLLQVHVVICGSRRMVGWERWRKVSDCEIKSCSAAVIH